jgi:hypothetical protein
MAARQGPPGSLILLAVLGAPPLLTGCLAFMLASAAAAFLAYAAIAA